MGFKTKGTIVKIVRHGPLYSTNYAKITLLQHTTNKEINFIAYMQKKLANICLSLDVGDIVNIDYVCYKRQRTGNYYRNVLSLDKEATCNK